MSGNPAFQGNPVAFQSNAFQAGVQVVAPNYSLGSPVFATPTWKIIFQFSASAYSLGSPVFATPTLTITQLVLHANSYSLGALSIATPYVRAVHSLGVNSYSLGPLSYGAPGLGPGVGQNHRLFANAYALASPAFAAAPWKQNYKFTATPLT